MAIGIDQNRLSLLVAVLEKRAGLSLVGEDVFVNVAGGMSIDEPAADLAVVAAVASSVRNRPVRQKTAVFGEVGLAGEVRAVTQAAPPGQRSCTDGVHSLYPSKRQPRSPGPRRRRLVRGRGGVGTSGKRSTRCSRRRGRPGPLIAPAGSACHSDP